MIFGKNVHLGGVAESGIAGKISNFDSDLLTFQNYWLQRRKNKGMKFGC